MSVIPSRLRIPPFLFQGLAGWRFADAGPDLVAGIVVAAIAVPEQMATARLGHFPPELGLLAFVAASAGFAVFGFSRSMSVGADSTITPIFAAGLALVAAPNGVTTIALAGMLALMTGVMLAAAGTLRLGWIASLLSLPVVDGFLAGIAVHIAVSQAPAVLGVTPASGDLLAQVQGLSGAISQARPATLAIGLGVFALSLAAEKINRRIPGALIAVVFASLIVWLAGLAQSGVAMLALPAPVRLTESWLAVPLIDAARLVPLALILWVVVMVQTAATARSFAAAAQGADEFNRDLVGLGASNIAGALAGTFPVDASPPRTAAAAESGATSQMSGLVAAGIVAVLSLFGTRFLHFVPEAAVAGILLYVACRITRVNEIAKVSRQSRGEFLLILATVLAIVVLPIEAGVGAGILLSMLHGLWTATRTRLIELCHVRGTTLWWPPAADVRGETVDGVHVVAFQAPLSFLNAEDLRAGFMPFLERGDAKLIVLEASGNAEIDYTAAQVLLDIADACGRNGVVLAIARLESVRAADALKRFGVLEKIGPERVFRSVDEAVTTLHRNGQK